MDLTKDNFMNEMMSKHRPLPQKYARTHTMEQSERWKKERERETFRVHLSAQKKKKTVNGRIRKEGKRGWGEGVHSWLA